MQRRFVLPAAFSLTSLAFLFFGFAKTTVSMPLAAKDPITELTLAKLPPEMPPEMEPMEKTRAKVPAPPSLPEPVDPVDLTRITEASLPPRLAPPDRGHPSLTIDPDIFRVGEGDGDRDGGISGSPVIDAALLDGIPRARTQSPPSYPSSARVAGISGEVVVEFVVDRTGRVLNPRIVRSSDPLFEESALRAVAKWIFEPGMKANRPVSFRMVVPVRYRVGD